MMNYLKSEWYRITRSNTIYLFTFILAGLTLAMNILLFVVGQSDPGFRYATARFSLSNLIAQMVLLLVISGILVIVLYDDDRKNGTLKNSLIEGTSRWSLFTAKSLVCVLAGIISMAFILLVYLGSAVLLLEGPVAEAVQILLGGVAAALPSIIAVVVFAVACLHMFNNTTMAFIFWAIIVFVVPTVISVLGLYFEPLAVVASWLPTNFLQFDLSATMAEFTAPWETPFGLAKWLISGVGFTILFFVIGLWRTKKMEL